MIGSAAFTIPAAVWLLGQAPQKSDHHGGHDEHKEEVEEKEEPTQEESESKEEDTPSEEDKGGEEKESDKSEADSDEKKDEKSKDEGKEEKSDDSSSDGGDDKGTPDTSDSEDDGKLDGYEKPSSAAPGQINYRPELGKGPGEGQKGTGKRTEKKAEKDVCTPETASQKGSVH